MLRRLIVFIAMLSAASLCRAGEYRILYADPTGWRITAYLEGTDIVGRYAQLSSFIRDRLDGENPPPAQMKYIFEHGDTFFYGFLLDIPQGIMTLWNMNSNIVLTYTCAHNASWFSRKILRKKMTIDTLRTRSVECFFATAARPNRLLFLGEQTSDLIVPPSGFALYSERHGPMVFARFQFNSLPDKLLSCTVSNVRTHERR